jgi:hypothetical protein
LRKNKQEEKKEMGGKGEEANLLKLLFQPDMYIGLIT